MNEISPAEAAALSALQAVREDGPALVRLLADLQKWACDATYPRLVLTWTTDEDYESDEDGYHVPVLTCPTCGERVHPDTLAAVDVAERWTYAEDFDLDYNAAPGEEQGGITFDYDGHGEYEGAGYYLHDTGKAHPVQLPDQVEEVTL